ncbi:MAG: carboxypeptidase M32, partial [Planctomycetota bacterium]
LDSCASVLSWDQETYMPDAGTEHRARQLSLLAGLAHRRKTAPALRELLDRAEGRAAGSPEEANVREARRDYDLSVKLPPELVEELAHTTSLARRAWVEARKKREFPLFRPWLEKIVALKRREAEARGYAEDPYDTFVDLYEAGETRESLARIFTPLREALSALLGKILGSSRGVDDALLRRRYPIPAQAEFARRAAARIGFDFGRGRLDVTAHPFCSPIGPGDTRLTNRYDEHSFGEAFFGVLHEAGHGMYEQGLDAGAFGTPMGEACSFGVHESQSRLWENFVGRGRPFWRHFFPEAQKAFPEALGHVAPEEFYRAINAVRPSFIRTDADEVTYNLHIFLRAELEQALLSGDLAVADLPGAWNEAFARDFRIRPSHDADGCLQDVHWSGGSFGYFPTYALGNVYAAQIHAKAREEIDGLDASVAKGDFADLRRWLNEKVHRHGRHHRPRRLVELATGARPSPDALVAHLDAKYGEVYGL